MSEPPRPCTACGTPWLACVAGLMGQTADTHVPCCEHCTHPETLSGDPAALVSNVIVGCPRCGDDEHWMGGDAPEEILLGALAQPFAVCCGGRLQATYTRSDGTRVAADAAAVPGTAAVRITLRWDVPT